jgi:hypothetical protein
LEEGRNGRTFPPSTTNQADVAIHAIGKKGIPSLLLLLQTKDSALKLKLMEWAEKQSLVEFGFEHDWVCQGQAIEGFMTLGSEAKEALPTLSGLLQDTDLACNVALCLGAIGPDAIPILRQELSNTRSTRSRVGGFEVSLGHRSKLKLAGGRALSLSSRPPAAKGSLDFRSGPARFSPSDFRQHAG